MLNFCVGYDKGISRTYAKRKVILNGITKTDTYFIVGVGFFVMLKQMV